MTKAWTRWALTAGALVLAGCQTAAVTPDVAAVPEPALVEPDAPVLNTLPPAAVLAPAPPPINDDPAQVIGLAAPALNDLLGEPRFVRRDLTAEVWQYHANACVLDVFLYEHGTVGADGAQVVHYEVRANRGDAGARAQGLPARVQRTCFAQLLKSRDSAAS